MNTRELLEAAYRLYADDVVGWTQGILISPGHLHDGERRDVCAMGALAWTQGHRSGHTANEDVLVRTPATRGAAHTLAVRILSRFGSKDEWAQWWARGSIFDASVVLANNSASEEWEEVALVNAMMAYQEGETLWDTIFSMEDQMMEWQREHINQVMSVPDAVRMTIAGWNDAEGRNKDEVLDLFKDAVVHAPLDG